MSENDSKPEFTEEHSVNNPDVDPVDEDVEKPGLDSPVFDPIDKDTEKLHSLIDNLADLIFDLYDLTLNMRLRGRYIAKEIKEVHVKIENVCNKTNGLNLSSFPKLERCVKKIKKK